VLALGPGAACAAAPTSNLQGAVFLTIGRASKSTLYQWKTDFQLRSDSYGLVVQPWLGGTSYRAVFGLIQNTSLNHGRIASRLCSRIFLSNPTLPPNAVVLQLTPGDDLRGFGKHGFDFHRYDLVGGQFGLNHPVDQEVLLFGDGFDGSPLGQ
jgi:hypothetical protein